MGYRRYPGYPRCPHCGHALPIDDFYRQVGARRVPSFWTELSASPRFRKDPITGEEVPSQFAISCTRCGTKSAVDTWPGDKIQLALLAGLALLLVLMILVLRARGGTSFAVFVCVVAYVGAALIPLKIAAVITSRMLRVTPISGPIAGWDNESRTDRLARSDRDMDVEIARLGPDFQVPEMKPLEPGLADVAARIDAAYVAAPPSTSERPEYERAEEQELERAKVVCAGCGEMNQRDFEKCWNCEAVLAERGS